MPAFAFYRPTRLLLFLGLLSLLLPRAWAQAPAWQWATSLRPGTSGGGTATAVDGAGNVYVTGWFADSAFFGSIGLRSAGSRDVFVAKFSSGGTCLWAVRAGGADYYEYGQSVTLDPSGNVYVTGHCADTAAFGATTLLQGGTFVAKLSAAGAWQWAVSVGDHRYDESCVLAVDGSGSVYVSDVFFGTVTFGATTLTSAGFGDVYVAKLTPTGAYQWVVRAGGTAPDESTGLALDPVSGSVLLTGYFASPTATFGSTDLTNSGALNTTDVFVAKLTPAGGWLWATQAGGGGISGNDSGGALVVDSTGACYVAGTVGSTTATFGAFTVGSLGGEAFVAKLSPVGTWQWATATSGISSTRASALARDGHGHLYVTGQFAGQPTTFGGSTLTNGGAGSTTDAFVASLTTAGTWEWATALSGADNDYGYGVGADARGNVYATGYFTSPTLAVGPTTLTNTVGNGFFLARLSSATLGSAPTVPTASLTLVPNPARETVMLTGASALTAEVLDALGRVVRNQSLPAGTGILDLRGLAPGLYTVRAGTATRRLAVE